MSTIWPGAGKSPNRIYRFYKSGQEVEVTIGAGGLVSKMGFTDLIYGSSTIFDGVSGDFAPKWSGVLEIFGNEFRASGGGLGAGSYDGNDAYWYGAGGGGKWNTYDDIVGPKLGKGMSGCVIIRYFDLNKTKIGE